MLAPDAHRLLLSSALLALALLSGCNAKIGDGCLVSSDCSVQGERSCDLSHRVDQDGEVNAGGNGECTIEGCNRGNCPKEAICTKVYSDEFLSVACDPRREDVSIPDPSETCEASSCPGLPPLNDCAAHEVCLPEGLCADELSARTSCRRECKKSSDCRAGYYCTRTGINGIYLAPDPDNPLDETESKLCVPL